MIRLTVGQMFSCFIQVFVKCGMFILDLPDKDIEYLIFEQFIGNVQTHMQNYTLNILEEYGMIDEEIFKRCLVLRTEVDNLKYIKNYWNVELVKRAANWHKVLMDCDEIKNLLTIKWTDEEIDALTEISDIPRLPEYLR